VNLRKDHYRTASVALVAVAVLDTYSGALDAARRPRGWRPGWMARCARWLRCRPALWWVRASRFPYRRCDELRPSLWRGPLDARCCAVRARCLGYLSPPVLRWGRARSCQVQRAVCLDGRPRARPSCFVSSPFSDRNRGWMPVHLFCVVSPGPAWPG
jgi:hypothetical protein